MLAFNIRGKGTNGAAIDELHSPSLGVGQSECTWICSKSPQIRSKDGVLFHSIPSAPDHSNTLNQAATSSFPDHRASVPLPTPLLPGWASGA